MKNEPIFSWSPEQKCAVCAITDDNKTFYGTAYCDPEDEDMMSEKTGYEIAYRRARIKACRYTKNQLKERLAALNQLYYSMNRSKKFNEKSYENRMLQRQLRLIKDDLATVKDMIATEEQNLRNFIENKDKFYKKVRANRNKAKSK